MNSSTETTSTTQAAAVAAQVAHVPARAARTTRKATSKPRAASAAKRAKKAATKKKAAKPGTKKEQVVTMLQCKGGVTLDEMGWQRHTVRGFMAGAMKKAGYSVESFKPEGGERTYRINQ